MPGALQVLGTPVDLGGITVPVFVTGAVNDHLTPWTGCYRTTELLSGPSTYVLSNAGHIANLVNPPGNPKASYLIGGTPGSDPEKWRETAEKRNGTWWEAWGGLVARMLRGRAAGEGRSRQHRAPSTGTGARVLRPRPDADLTREGPAVVLPPWSARRSSSTAGRACWSRSVGSSCPRSC